MSNELNQRLETLEAAYEKLTLSNEQIERRYKGLLAMVREAASSSAAASAKALEATEKSLFAGTQAATAAKEAAVLGALKVAETALQAARAAADAAGDGSVAAMEAWKTSLVIAGHNADPENLKLSITAHAASTAASAAAIKALAVFGEAFEAVKKATLG